ncbi:MAG: serine/threonine protein kinase, partial [Candidatus Latescibacteria bacterium]|nr:serine/threonine protein kinase [Candidatus Latescibacterota bacterium]
MLGPTLSHYRIIRQLGQGGMGEVYLAEDLNLKRQVALKVLPEAVRNDPERLRRFRTEAEAAAKLNHPNIAQIYSIEEADGVLFITMEYVDGQTLHVHIPPDGLTLDRFFEWFIPLSDALTHAHEHGVTHRDLKPGNIMIRVD